jgi:hypothetical protein
VVISQVETSMVGGNPGLQVGDNFTLHQNPVVEPPLSPSPEEFSIFGHMADEEERNREPEGESTFGFPILDLMPNVNMKNIPPSVLPNFRGMVTEDPYAFLFEFDILCRSYNYVDDAQKLKLFPTTLKDSALRWFMGLEDYSIRSWEDMKSTFLKKYQDYCRTRDSHNDIFKMQQSEEESLEDYVERFLYNLQKTKQSTLNNDTIRTIFLKGIQEEYIDVLNLMGAGDISQLPFAAICDLCRRYSRSRAKSSKGVRDVFPKVTRSTARRWSIKDRIRKFIGKF